MNSSASFHPASQRAFAVWVYLVTLVALGLAAFVALVFYQNIVDRKAEARKDVFRVVEVSDETVDPAIWGKNYPRQYDSYRRTVDTERTNHGGSEAFQHLDEDPVWRRLFAGYAFGVDYREERGHAYMLLDQKETERVTKFKQPGACLQCHASTLNLYINEGL
jgi:nitrite reductase (cytochrome c-552)